MDAGRKPKVKTVHEEVDAALKAIAARHGCRLEKSSCTYSETDMRFTIVVREAVAPPKEAEDFRLYARQWGLEPGDLGAKFRMQGQEWELVGIKPGSTKWPFLIKRLKDGKLFKGAATSIPWLVNEAKGREQTPISKLLAAPGGLDELAEGRREAAWEARVS